MNNDTGCGQNYASFLELLKINAELMDALQNAAIALENARYSEQPAAKVARAVLAKAKAKNHEHPPISAHS